MSRLWRRRSGSGRPHRPFATVAIAGVSACLLAALAFIGYWAASGGRWYIVESPSMGTAAPVGTLLWVKPVRFASIHIGQIITFHPPIAPAETYTHRVVAKFANSTLSTKGDINPAPDPWRLHAANVIGGVSARWPVVGWLVHAAPLLIGGALLLWLLITRFTIPQWRRPATIAGASLIVALAIYIYKPLFRAALLSFERRQHGGRATYVNTGLLPLRLTAAGHHPISLSDGQVGSLTVTHPSAHDRPWVSIGPHLPWWFWVLLITICFLPAIATALVGRQTASDLPSPSG